MNKKDAQRANIWKKNMVAQIVATFGIDGLAQVMVCGQIHDDAIKWRHFPRYWPFVRGIHRSPVNSPHKGQWRGALMFSLIWVWINGWVNNLEAGDSRRHHCDVTVMYLWTNTVLTHCECLWMAEYELRWNVSQTHFCQYCLVRSRMHHCVTNLIGCFNVISWDLMGYLGLGVSH